MADESRDEYDIRTRAAEMAHDNFHKNAAEVFKMVASFSNAAMRAPAIAAAGGIAALLAFGSANPSMSDGPAIGNFNAALWWFFVAVMLCVLAPGVAYFSQTFYVSANGARTLSYVHPFVHDTRGSKSWGIAGEVMRFAAIVLVLGAIAALGVGGGHFLRVVKLVAASS